MRKHLCSVGVSLLTLLLLLLGYATAMAAPGDLDPDFGDRGMVVTNIGDNDSVNVKDSALQPDGKIIVVGAAGSNGWEPWWYGFILRYNEDGSLDAGFGTNGKVTVSYTIWEEVAVQPDRRIVVVGTCHGDGIVARFLPNGEPDPSFGTTGSVDVDVGMSVALQSDGKIVAGLHRLNVDGSLDTGFASGGIIELPGVDSTARTAVQSDDKILVAYVDQERRYVVMRCGPDGLPDQTFGQDGFNRVPMPNGPAPSAWIADITIDQEGRILLAYSWATGITSPGGDLLRFTSEGVLDQTFANNGFIAQMGTSDYWGDLNQVLILPNGQVIWGDFFMSEGWDNGYYDTLKRYYQDGTLDGGFGIGGVVKVPYNVESSAMVLRLDGKVVIVGELSSSVALQCYLVGEADNIVLNSSFEEGKEPWRLYTNGKGNFRVEDPAYHGDLAAKVHIEKAGKNVQLYQKDLTLEPNTRYRLAFAAKSSNGQDLSVYLHKHTSPYTHYGLTDWKADLTEEWQVFGIEFVTENFDTTVRDARLRFWFGYFNTNRMDYWIDGVRLYKVEAGEAVAQAAMPAAMTAAAAEPGMPVSSGANLLRDSGFEEASGAWVFHTKGKGSFGLTDGVLNGSQTAELVIEKAGKTAQLYQAFQGLEPGRAYRLRLQGAASREQAVLLFIHEHEKPYAEAGLNGAELHLTEAAQRFEVRFTSLEDAGAGPLRLRLELGPSAAAGDRFWFDEITLEPIDEHGLEAASEADSLLVSGYFIDAHDQVRQDGEKVAKEDGLAILEGAGLESPADLPVKLYMPTVRR